MVRRNFSKFQGNLPLLPSKMIDRKKTAEMYGFTVAGIFKAYQAWINTLERPESDLTFEQYLNKLKESKLTPFDIGQKIDKYQLSRINDEGGYSDKTCRFLLHRDNLAEQKKNYKNKNLNWGNVIKDLKTKSLRAVAKEHQVNRSSIRKYINQSGSG